MAGHCPHGYVYDVNCGRCGELYLAREEGRREGIRQGLRSAEEKILAAHARGYAACRADVVAWANHMHTEYKDSSCVSYAGFAEDVEAGEHVGRAAKKEGG